MSLGTTYWTNLIDNAVAAMEVWHGHAHRTDRPRRRLRAGRDWGYRAPGSTSPLFASGSSSPSSPPNRVGGGHRLGLDISWRIVVNKHHGDLAVESVLSDTRFRVQLSSDTRRDPDC